MASRILRYTFAAGTLGLIYFAITVDKILPTEDKLSEIHQAKFFIDISMSNTGTFNDKVIEKQNKVLEEIWKRAPKQ